MDILHPVQVVHKKWAELSPKQRTLAELIALCAGVGLTAAVTAMLISELKDVRAFPLSIVRNKMGVWVENHNFTYRNWIPWEHDDPGPKEESMDDLSQYLTNVCETRGLTPEELSLALDYPEVCVRGLIEDERSYPHHFFYGALGSYLNIDHRFIPRRRVPN